jgi:acetate---CoA ligase (ADP-forming)
MANNPFQTLLKSRASSGTKAGDGERFLAYGGSVGRGGSGLDFERTNAQVAALTEPRNVVIVGASDRPGNWAARARRNLARYGFPGKVFLLNPRRSEIDGEICYPDFSALPEPPDHLLVVVPATAVCGALEAGAAAGARSATIFSSGFGEAFDQEGAELGKRLRDVIARTELGVSGPNCMGNICTKTSFVTLTEDRPTEMKPGPIALVGQSGGVMIFINQALEERGMKAEYLITSGNEAGLQIADYIAFFATQPELKAIIVYVEAINDVGRFKAACRLARKAGKSIIAVKLGQSESGREAAMAHTGSLAGSIAAFDALAREIGVIRADTLDDVVELAELLVHTGPSKGPRIGAVTLSGAYRGLLLDAAERNGVSFPPLAAATVAKLEKALSVGSLIGNPIDGGFGVLSSADAYRACIEALQEDPQIDIVLLQEALPREAGSARGEAYIKMVEDYAATRATKPIAFVTLVTHSQTPYSRELRAQAPHVSFLQEANKALRAIAAAARRCAWEAFADDPPLARDLSAAPIPALFGDAAALDEAASKDLLRSYGIRTPQEQLARSAEEAAAAAAAIGFPVVLKAASAKLPHKSDVGGVMLGLRDADQVKSAWAEIECNVRKHGFEEPLDGMLVCQQISGGLELALGLHRDPEVGLIVMAGAGGVLLELIKDVAFCLPPVTREKARETLARTQISKLLAGYRGGLKLDEDAVLDAMMALGRIAEDCSDALEAIDVNPFVVLPAGKGGLALDALAALRRAK